MRTGLQLPKDGVAALCRRHGIRTLSVFGSVPRGEARPDSDVDLLVEFEAGRVPGFLRLHEIEAEFAELLGRRVDLVTRRSLNARIRDRVLAEAQPAYDRG